MIIRTILDTDLYKFTTSYAYIKLFPYAIGTFSFKDRDGTEYSDEFVERLRTEISQLSHVALTEKELEYMIKNCRFLPRVYWEWLSSFRFQPEKIEIRLDENRQLHIEVNDYTRHRFGDKEPIVRQCCQPGRHPVQTVRKDRTVQ